MLGSVPWIIHIITQLIKFIFESVKILYSTLPFQNTLKFFSPLAAFFSIQLLILKSNIGTAVVLIKYVFSNLQALCLSGIFESTKTRSLCTTRRYEFMRKTNFKNDSRLIFMFTIRTYCRIFP